MTSGRRGADREQSQQTYTIGLPRQWRRHAATPSRSGHRAPTLLDTAFPTRRLCSGTSAAVATRGTGAGVALPPLSLPDEWTRPSQPEKGTSGPGASAGGLGLPERPAALISRQRRQAIANQRLTEGVHSVQQGILHGSPSRSAPPGPSAGGLDHGATTAGAGGGRVNDTGGEPIVLLEGS